MGSKKSFELLGTSVRAILEILWERGLSSMRQIQRHHGVAYETLATTVNIMLAKGRLTRLREDRLPHFFAAVPRTELLCRVFEQQLLELGATAAERAHILEALRHE